MMLRKMIEELLALEEKHGNIPVKFITDGGYKEVGGVSPKAGDWDADEVVSEVAIY